MLNKRQHNASFESSAASFKRRLGCTPTLADLATAMALIENLSARGKATTGVDRTGGAASALVRLHGAPIASRRQ